MNSVKKTLNLKGVIDTMPFIKEITSRARADKKRIVLSEGMDKRIWKAAQTIVNEEIADIIVIASKEEEEKYSKGFNTNGVTVIDPFTFDKLDDYANKLYELRKAKGMTLEEAKRLLTTDYIYFACMMLLEGAADGVVSGAAHSTANTLRPALQLIKTKPGTELVSSFFVMVVPDCEFGHHGTFVFGDCSLEQNPTPEKLSSIALSSAESYRLLVQEEPIVALLSHSTMGSAKHSDVDKVKAAVDIAKASKPDFLLDGELQLDAAICYDVAETKAPDSKVAGKANVLIFPDLDAANIGYKLVQRLAKADAYGPITQGIKLPVNDLSRGCSSSDIVGVVAITVVQAQANDY